MAAMKNSLPPPRKKNEKQKTKLEINTPLFLLSSLQNPSLVLLNSTKNQAYLCRLSLAFLQSLHIIVILVRLKGFLKFFRRILCLKINITLIRINYYFLSKLC